MNRHELSLGLGPQLDALRRLRTSRRIGEIAFFASLWILGIAAPLHSTAATPDSRPVEA